MSKSIKVIAKPAPQEPEPLDLRRVIQEAKRNVTETLQMSIVISKEVFGESVPTEAVFGVYDRFKQEMDDLIAAALGDDDEEEDDEETDEDE
jgi:hypothetical protein